MSRPLQTLQDSVDLTRSKTSLMYLAQRTIGVKKINTLRPTEMKLRLQATINPLTQEGTFNLALVLDRSRKRGSIRVMESLCCKKEVTKE